MPFIEIGSAINAINNIVQGIKDKKLKQAEILVELEKLKIILHTLDEKSNFNNDSSPMKLAKRIAEIRTILSDCPKCKKTKQEKISQLQADIEREGTFEEQFYSDKTFINIHNENALHNLMQGNYIAFCPDHKQLVYELKELLKISSSISS